MIANKSIQEVLNAASTRDIIEEFVTLRTRGVNLIGLCPFHDEKTPSFTVSPSKNIYKCFGCGKAGNAVSFLMEHEQMSFVESIRYLAQRYNIELEESNEGNKEEYEQQKKLQDSLFIVNEFACNHFQETLLKSEPGSNIARAYLKERGFLDKTIHTFRLGYADADYKSFTQKAISQHFKQEWLNKLGLTSSKGNDFFRDRVIFPIQNLSGEGCGFCRSVIKKQRKSAEVYKFSGIGNLYQTKYPLWNLSG